MIKAEKILVVEDEEAFSNVLEVPIYNIRKRLGTDFCRIDAAWAISISTT